MQSTIDKPLMPAEKLPRVLIIGQTFTSDTGGGITMSSLFKDWPKNKLAIAVESKESLDFDKCSNYYRLGYDELKMPFPFDFFQRKTKSGLVSEHKIVGALAVKQTSPLKEKIKRNFDNVLHKLGLFYFLYGNQKVSAPLMNWIEEFNPEVIYYQPNSYKSIPFVLSVHARLKIPLACHVMDDWFSFTIRNSPLKSYWQNKLDKRVEALFKVSGLHLSICQYMSDNYLKKYGYVFYPYHNSVDIDFWRRPRQITQKKPIQLLYAGRIGYGIDHMLLKVSNVIEKMGEDGKQVQLEIQTKDQQHPILTILANHQHLKISEPIDYARLPSKFSGADLLLIPCDFDGEGVAFIRYSMPTKVSEYMATGTPILVIGPPETALTEYAREGWAYVCESNEAKDIELAIDKLVSSKTLQEKIVAKAQELVVKNHDQLKIMKQFRKQLTELTERR